MKNLPLYYAPIEFVASGEVREWHQYKLLTNIEYSIMKSNAISLVDINVQSSVSKRSESDCHRIKSCLFLQNPCSKIEAHLPFNGRTAFFSVKCLCRWRIELQLLM